MQFKREYQILKLQQLHKNEITMEQNKQAYLSSCQNYLMRPEYMKPKELAEYFVGNTNYGLNDHIASLVQHYFYVNLNTTQKIRYIHLIDSLIKYSFSLPKSFVRMFSLCFQESVINQKKNLQQELIVLYKTWSPILNDDIISSLRNQVFKMTKFDIQQNMSSQSKKYLHQFYLNNLMLSSQEIYELLYKKKRSLRNYKQIIQPNIIDDTDLGQRRKKVKKSEEIQNQTSTSNDSQIFSKRQQAYLILNKLKNSSDFNCKQCGKFFKSIQSYQKHKQQHFNQRMENFRSKCQKRTIKTRISKRAQRKQLSLQQWLLDKETQESIQKSNVCIELGHELGYNKLCYICQEQFIIDIVNDSFVYKNAVKIQIQQDQTGIAHTDCFKAIMYHKIQ